MPDLLYRDNLTATSHDALEFPCAEISPRDRMMFGDKFTGEVSVERRSNIDVSAPRKDVQGYSNPRHSSAICRVDMAVTPATDG
jgi:hypothetical protein